MILPELFDYRAEWEKARKGQEDLLRMFAALLRVTGPVVVSDRDLALAESCTVHSHFDATTGDHRLWVSGASDES